MQGTMYLRIILPQITLEKTFSIGWLISVIPMKAGIKNKKIGRVNAENKIPKKTYLDLSFMIP